MREFGTGSAWFLAAVLTVAAMAKVSTPSALAEAARRVLPPRIYNGHRRLMAQSGRLVAVVELAVAVALIAGPRIVERAGSVVALALTATFVVVVVVAIAHGAGCGCWGSFTSTQAGGAELARAAVLLVVAIAHLVAEFGDGGTEPPRPVAALAWAGALAGATVLASHAGAVLLRRRLPGPKHPGRITDRSPTAVDHVVAFLLAADPDVRVRTARPPDVALWPWSNRAAIARFRRSPEVGAELDRMGPAAGRLRWRDLVVYQDGTGQRRLLVTGDRAHLAVRQETGGRIVATGLDLDSLPAASR